MGDDDDAHAHAADVGSVGVVKRVMAMAERRAAVRAMRLNMVIVVVVVVVDLLLLQ